MTDRRVIEAQEAEQVRRAVPHRWQWVMVAVDAAVRAVRDLGFPIVVAAVFMWAVLKELPRHLNQVSEDMGEIRVELKLMREQGDRHTQQLIELLKDRK